jgi:hypothetical protein
MTHYSAGVAVMVTSSGFTLSARSLSATTGVVLLLHSEVDRFDELLKEGGPAREPVRVGRQALHRGDAAKAHEIQVEAANHDSV